MNWAAKQEKDITTTRPAPPDQAAKLRYLRQQINPATIDPSRPILVTGGTGFIGSYIIRELLQKGYAVRALRRGTALPAYIGADLLTRVEWVEGDVLDLVSLEDAMTGVDAVIHAAAVVSFHRRDTKRMHQVNVEGTAHVVNTALEAGVRRRVHVSSVAALGRSGTGGQVDEEKKWEDSRLNTAYAISKHRAEMEVWRAIAEGLEAVIVNPSTVLGFGDWNRSSCRLFKSAFESFPWYSNGVNGFVCIGDVARATVLLMESPLTAERYILNGENWRFRDLFNCMADAFGTRRPVREATPLLAALAWRLERVRSLFTGKPPLLTRESARVANSHTYFTNQKIRDALPGFSFTPLKACIENACKSYLQAINSPVR